MWVMAVAWEVLRRLPLIIGLLLSGCSLSHPNESESYRNQIEVNGYEAVEMGSAEREAYVILVGAARSDEDLVESVMGPSLELSTSSNLMKPQIGVFRDVAAGVGYSDATGRCSVWLTVVKPGREAVDYAGREPLSDEQQDGVVRGTLSVVRVDVLCQSQADLPAS
jgi:hypothetical protein